MLSEAEVLTQLPKTELLVFDTNTVGARILREFLELAGRVEEVRGVKLKVAVPRLCDAEHQLQERHRWGIKYDPATSDEGIKRFIYQGGCLLDFDAEAAKEHGRALALRFPDTGSWHVYRKEAQAQRAVVGRRQGTTVDWFIASQASHTNRLMVTHDKGPEFQWLPAVVTPKVLRSALKSYLQGL